MSEHGTVQRFWIGCSCLPCRAAAARYNLGRIHARRSGDWQGYVPPEKAMAHLKQFKNIAAVADVSGMNASYLSSIRAGSRRQIRAATEKRILAIEAETVEKQRKLFASDGVLVAAAPVRKMIRALAAEGFDSRTLARRLNLVGGMRLKGKTVRAWNAMRIEKFYNMIMAEGEAA